MDSITGNQWRQFSLMLDFIDGHLTGKAGNVNFGKL